MNRGWDICMYIYTRGYTRIKAILLVYIYDDIMI